LSYLYFIFTFFGYTGKKNFLEKEKPFFKKKGGVVCFYVSGSLSKEINVWLNG
jgi:hypothetical protein